MPVSGIQGLRGTGTFSTDFRPTNYREMFTLLEPNGDAPLNALLSMTSSESSDDPKFSNFRDELPERVMQINGAITSTAGTVQTLTLDSSTENLFAIAGSILVNAASGEVMHVTTTATATSVAVKRNIGGTSHAILDNAKLYVAGFAAAEGADTPEPISFDSVVAFNITQIFRTAFSVTRTLKNSHLRTGDKETESMEKALKLHMSDIERAMLFGVKHTENPTTSTPTRFTGGVTNEITGVYNVAAGEINAVNSTMTEKEFDNFLIETVFAYGSKEKIFFCGAKIAGHLQAIGKNRWSPTQVEGSYGVNFVRYQTFAGDLLVHVHPQFRQIPSMNNAAIILDFPFLKYRYLDSSDTQILMDRQGNGEDRKKHEYLTECGLELTQDKVHQYIKGWTTLG
tara:strand:- start:6140 stop:7333 length:1194 start_codon:yes stop_codon:yes gene_type:complete